MHRFDIKTIQNVEIRRKTFKTTQTNESDQIIMHCIDLTSKRSKLELRRKTTKWSNYSALHRFDVKTIENVEWRHKTFKTTQNYKTDQITMNCCYLMSKRSKQLKTTTLIKLQWIASIWRLNNPKCWVTSQNYESDQIIVHCIDLTSKRSKCWDTSQNIQNNAKLRKWSNYSALHRFDVKTIKNVEIRRKTFKTTQNYESDQIIVHCIDLTSKRSKMLRYVAKHSKQRKPTKVIKL